MCCGYVRIEEACVGYKKNTIFKKALHITLDALSPPLNMASGGMIGCFSLAGTGKLLQLDEKIGGDKYRAKLKENLRLM